MDSASEKSKGRPVYVQEKDYLFWDICATFTNLQEITVFKHCEHPEALVPTRPYLNPRSTEIQKLRDILCGKNNSRYEGVKMLDKIQHTGIVECISSVHNYTFCSKSKLPVPQDYDRQSNVDNYKSQSEH